jgi:hypothetical protein
MAHPARRLGNAVHPRTRLGILTILAGADRADFSFLRGTLALTDAFPGPGSPSPGRAEGTDRGDPSPQGNRRGCRGPARRRPAVTAATRAGHSLTSVAWVLGRWPRHSG